MNYNEGLVLPIGTSLCNNRYRIDQYLSSGGFGNTYLATDMSFNEKVAIKELFLKGTCDRFEDSLTVSVSVAQNKEAFEMHREKFKKEAIRIRKLNNPHIVKVYDLFEANGTSYYVMEYIDGESLSSRIKNTGHPFTEKEVFDILSQILDALEQIHSHNIWHLDLKPGNIMIDKNEQVKLIDFGASKQIRSTEGATLSTSSVLSYTNGYAPVEQLEQNMDRFGPWTDLYSLGATIYNLLTMGVPPSPSEIAEDGSSAFNFSSNLSDTMKQLIVWLMQPSRNNRPQNVTAVKNMLSYSSAQKKNNDIPQTKQSSLAEEEENTVIIGQNSNYSSSDETIVVGHEQKSDSNDETVIVNGLQNIEDNNSNVSKKNNKTIVYIIVSIISAIIIALIVFLIVHKKQEPDYTDLYSSVIEIDDSDEETDEEIEEEAESDYSDFSSSTGNNADNTVQVEEQPKPVAKPTRGQVSGLEWVDLGLPSGTKWATCNMGAGSPSDYGDHVSFYDKEYYLASGWHVPTYNQAVELIQNCSKSYSGGGYTFTGPNGQSIFIPSSGYCKDGVLHQGGVYGDFWTNASYNGNDAWEISWTNNKGPHMNHDGKHYEACVRPVTN